MQYIDPTIVHNEDNIISGPVIKDGLVISFHEFDLHGPRYQVRFSGDASLVRKVLTHQQSLNSGYSHYDGETDLIGYGTAPDGTTVIANLPDCFVAIEIEGDVHDTFSPDAQWYDFLGLAKEHVFNLP